MFFLHGRLHVLPYLKFAFVFEFKLEFFKFFDVKILACILVDQLLRQQDSNWLRISKSDENARNRNVARCPSLRYHQTGRANVHLVHGI